MQKYYFTILLVMTFISCRPQPPHFKLDDREEVVFETNGIPIREIVIEQYDNYQNFMGKKYFYKYDTVDGSSKIYLFKNNEGYKGQGDSLFSKKGFVYKIYMKTLGFKDSLYYTEK